MKLFHCISAVITVALYLPTSPALAEDGSVKVCLSSDYEWQANKKILLPAGVVFGGEGEICGSLYQPSILPLGDKRLKCYQSSKVENFDSAFALSKSVPLSRKMPFTTAHARTVLWWHYTRQDIKASPSRAFIAWRIIGQPVWPRDSTPPVYVDPELARALDDFDIRAAVIRDIGDPIEVDEYKMVEYWLPFRNSNSYDLKRAFVELKE